MQNCSNNKTRVYLLNRDSITMTSKFSRMIFKCRADRNLVAFFIVIQCD